MQHLLRTERRRYGRAFVATGIVALPLHDCHGLWPIGRQAPNLLLAFMAGAGGFFSLRHSSWASPACQREHSTSSRGAGTRRGPHDQSQPRWHIVPGGSKQRGGLQQSPAGAPGKMFALELGANNPPMISIVSAVAAAVALTFFRPSKRPSD